MAYLINQLVWWLLLAATFAALAGWAYGAMKAEAETQNLKRERERLVREFVALAGDAPNAPAPDLHMQLIRQRTDVTESRVRDLEQALAQTRARAEAAEMRADAVQRELSAAQQTQPALTALADTSASSDDEAHQLQAWRLRYFESRAAYLERQMQTPLPTAEPVAAPAAEHDPIPQLHAEWRARFAEAAADELLNIAREPKTIASPAPSADEIETEQRKHWRMLYLERRALHLQNALEAAHAAPLAAADAMFTEDEARRSWRQSYLERRVAHLMDHAASMTQTPAASAQTLTSPVIAAPAPAEEIDQAAPAIAAALPETALGSASAPEEEAPPPTPLVPAGMEQRPPSMPAPRDGAPDDFTLIEGVSPMQQSTLNALGIYHFEQIAAWTPANIAWVDQYLRLRGRIVAEEWLEQAHDLAQGHGVARAERASEDA